MENTIGILKGDIKMKAMNNLKIGMLTCIGVLGLSSCFLAEKPKTFSNNGITITLDNTFFKVNMQDVTLAYTSSKGVNVLFYQTDAGLSSLFNAIDQSYTLYPVVEGEDYKELKNKGNISYYEFCYFEEGTEFYTLLTAFGDEYICEVDMEFIKSNQTLYEETVFTWLESVTIE